MTSPQRRHVCRPCCRCICCPPVPSVAAHKWPREDLSLLPPKPLNTHPTAAETDYITKGNIHKLWPRRTHGKLSYEQSGAVLKGVTWRGGDVSTPGGAGCPPPVLVALQTSRGPSRSAFWGPSLGSYCVVGDTNVLAAPPGPPPGPHHGPHLVDVPQIPLSRPPASQETQRTTWADTKVRAALYVVRQAKAWGR